MVHGVHLVDGKATYRNRWVRTAAFLEEEEAGEPKWGGILDPINPNRAELDKDTGNTDLVWHNGKLLATWWLGGTPYALKVPSLETEGPVDFSGKLACNMAAHPKVDPKTGELLFFDYSPYQAPYLQYGVVSGDGAKVHTTTIEVPGPRLFHDIAITEKHTIFLDLPMLWDTSAVSKGKRKVAFDTELPSRFGVLPRHAEGSEVRWFELPPSYIYHTINAYEDGDEIVMYACRIENPIPTLPPDQDPGVPRLYFLRLEPYLTRYRFNMTTGEAREEKLDDVMSEFPRMNDDRLGAKARYSYNPRVAPQPTLLFDAVMKYDLESGAKTVHEYGDGRFGDEPVFVPRPGGTDEDDGWLVTMVRTPADDKHEIEVWPAQDMAAEPIARVQIPRHVPVGFHAAWVPGEAV